MNILLTACKKVLSDYKSLFSLCILSLFLCQNLCNRRVCFWSWKKKMACLILLWIMLPVRRLWYLALFETENRNVQVNGLFCFLVKFTLKFYRHSDQFDELWLKHEIYFWPIHLILHWFLRESIQLCGKKSLVSVFCLL